MIQPLYALVLPGGSAMIQGEGGSAKRLVRRLTEFKQTVAYSRHRELAL